MPDERQEKQGSSQGVGIEGKYANYFQVGHNAFEFLLDFGQLYLEGKQEHFHTRIVTSPTYAVELLKVLAESIEQYERTFGSLESKDDDDRDRC
ncbi:MAG TPA: DUF3467 domain-containing protein [Terriglobales bacterium]